MSNYIGITIGPIVETLLLSSKPAYMWCASYIFSSLSRYIYLYLTDSERGNINRNEIISPYYPESEDKIMAQYFADGIGIHHDRIILKGAQGREAVVAKAVESAIKELAQKLASSSSDDKTDTAAEEWNKWLRNYLQVYTVSVDVKPGENPLIVVSRYLDAAEQRKKYICVNEGGGVGFSVLLGESGKGDNETIKKLAQKNGFAINLKDWQLTVSRNGRQGVRDIEHIADSTYDASAEAYKKYRSYYAFVQADGDNMGKLLKSMGGDEGKVRDFSTACIRFARDAADKIKAFGGVTIYAGGDDLCFLAPIVSEQGNNIFTLINTLQTQFDGYFKAFIDPVSEDKDKPSISFGVFISYCKFPLYEAYQAAFDMLAAAKSVNSKNAIAIKVRKHSGQQFGLTFGACRKQYGNAESPLSMLTSLLDIAADADVIKSVRTHIRTGSKLFDRALECPSSAEAEAMIKNLFKNIFDSDVQKKHAAYVGRIEKLFCAAYESGDTMKAIGDGKSDTVIDTVDSALSLMRFFAEETAAPITDNKEKNRSSKEAEA